MGSTCTSQERPGAGQAVSRVLCSLTERQIEQERAGLGPTTIAVSAVQRSLSR